PVGRRKAELDHPTDLEELRREKDVERAGHRIERERGRLRRAVTLREELDVVRGRAGTLGDARNRGAVDLEPVGQRRVDDPLEEDAATLPADGGDQDGQEPRVAHAVTAARRPMTRRRTRPTKRVHRVGFAITLTS